MSDEAIKEVTDTLSGLIEQVKNGDSLGVKNA